MDIKTYASVGSLESNDVYIELEPNADGEVQIDIESIVMQQYGESIREEIQSVLDSFGVTSGTVRANDHGALACVIQARMEAAILRSMRQK